VLLKGGVRERIPMQDAVAVVLIIVIVPICSIVALRALAKKKRHRRPVQDPQ
jgi:hypothetical protein